MPLSVRGFHHRFVLGGVLLAACGGDPEQEPAPSSSREGQVQGAEAAPEQQTREDPQGVELQQAVLAIESDPSAALSEGQFYQEIAYYCGACHIQPAYAEQYPLAYFDDLDRMIEFGQVLPGNAAGSPIIVHMRADQTPPYGWNTPPVTDIAITLVADFINQLPTESDESASGR